MNTTLPPITIVGAGISGLTLGLCLRHKGIPAVIYDRASSSPRYSYGIVLRSTAYRPLLSMLRMDEATFRHLTAVDCQQSTSTGPDNFLLPDSFRCHRGRLEDILKKDLTIRWDKRLKDVQLAHQTKSITAIFEDGERLSTTCLVGCDGPHSMVRQSLSSKMNLQVLPYVVFNGKRHISLDKYADTIHSYLQTNASAKAMKGNVSLEISVNDINGSSVSISYTYSRPARESNDALYKPDRPIAGATDIPEEFFQELMDLPELQQPFREIFNVEEVREDRLLHWLMRFVSPDLSEIERLADSDVILLGDAAHATPILGSEGANTAIQDGIDLAEHILAADAIELKKFSTLKVDTWTRDVQDSKQRIQEMHTVSLSNL